MKPHSIFLAACLCLSASAATLELVPSSDTTLFEDNPQNNLGRSDSLAAGTTERGALSRALTQFPVAENLPAGARVTGASVVLIVTKTPFGGGASSTFELRRMLMGWTEGRGTGNTGTLAFPGESTWAHRSFATIFWNTPGGMEGVDFAEASSASQTVAGVGAYTFASTPELVADVQHWLDQPAENFGWIVKTQSDSTDGTARRIGSRESPSVAPRLVIQYEIPIPLRIISVRIENGQVLLEWEGGAAPYQVQARGALTEPWTNAGTSLTAMEAAVPADGLMRFYRVGSGL